MAVTAKWRAEHAKRKMKCGQDRIGESQRVGAKRQQLIDGEEASNASEATKHMHMKAE